MATVLEALQNAQYNFNDTKLPQFTHGVAKIQLANAIVFLEKGYSPHDDIEETLSTFGVTDAEDLPDSDQI